MSDSTIWNLGFLGVPSGEDLLPIVDNPNGTPVTRQTTLARIGRLFLNRTARPTYTSVTTLSMGNINEMSSDGSTIISKSTNTVLTITNTGLNGRDAGVSVFANAWYYLYAISKDNGADPGLLMSITNEASGAGTISLPTGYTKKKQLAFAARTDASSNFIPWIVGMGWPDTPYIQYRGLNRLLNAATLVLNTNNGLTTYTDVDCSAWMPGISDLAEFNIRASFGSSNFFQLRPANSSNDDMSFVLASSASEVQSSFFMSTDTNRKLQYKFTGAGATALVAVNGFVVNKL